MSSFILNIHKGNQEAEDKISNFEHGAKKDDAFFQFKNVAFVIKNKEKKQKVKEVKTEKVDNLISSVTCANRQSSPKRALPESTIDEAKEWANIETLEFNVDVPKKAKTDL